MYGNLYSTFTSTLYSTSISARRMDWSNSVQKYIVVYVEPSSIDSFEEHEKIMCVKRFCSLSVNQNRQNQNLLVTFVNIYIRTIFCINRCKTSSSYSADFRRALIHSHSKNGLEAKKEKVPNHNPRKVPFQSGSWRGNGV